MVLSLKSPSSSFLPLHNTQEAAPLEELFSWQNR